MVAVKAADAEALIRRPDPRFAVILVYGPDLGLVNERARTVAERAVDDPSDPFQLIRLDGDVIASDPGRLADEAGTMGLFGSRRAIWVKPTSRNIAPSVEAVLTMPLQDTLVVVEAGDLGRSAPLRTLCERSPKAAALPCYADSDRDVGTVLDETLKAAGLAMSREARQAAVAYLGGDRLATRGELAKLVLYAHGRNEITVDDVDAVLSDVSGLAMDAVVDAAFSGDAGRLEGDFRRLAAEGVAPSLVLGAALRHALTLLSVRLEIESGRPASAALEGWKGLHFRRKPLVERQLGRFSAAALKDAIGALQASLLETRRMPDLSSAIASRALLKIASRSGSSTGR